MSTFNGIAEHVDYILPAQFCQIAPHVHNSETIPLIHPSTLSEAWIECDEETRMTNLGIQLLDLESQIRRIDWRGDGSDLFQDVALKCVEREKKQTFDWASESARRLILRIATNCQIDHFRRERLRRCQSLQDAPPTVLACPPETAILELTEALSSDDRRLVIDHLVGGKSLTEIAAERSRSPGGLRARWHRLRMKLRQENVA